MKKKTFVFWGLAIIVCFSLLAGCSQSSVTTSSSPTVTSSASSTPNVTSASQNVVNMPSFAGLIDAAEPSVVEIDVTATVSTRFRTVQQQGAGSGWIMDT